MDVLWFLWLLIAMVGTFLSYFSSSFSSLVSVCVFISHTSARCFVLSCVLTFRFVCLTSPLLSLFP